MNAARDDELDPQLARGLAELPEVRARARFERGLRERFVAGDLPTSAAAAPRRALGWLGPVSVALAAGLLLSLFLLQRRSPAPPTVPWRVLQAAGGASVFVNGQAVDASNGAELARNLDSGTHLRTPAGNGLVLVLGDLFALAIGPESELVLPDLASGDPPSPFVIDTHTGHVACATGPAFSGSRLVVRSPDAEVEVVGTRFAVDVYPEGTCVCCAQGEVAVRSLQAEGDVASVPGQGMAFAFSAGELATGAVVQGHLEPLTALEGIW